MHFAYFVDMVNGLSNSIYLFFVFLVGLWALLEVSMKWNVFIAVFELRKNNGKWQKIAKMTVFIFRSFLGWLFLCILHYAPFPLAPFFYSNGS